jgi:uncharacterized membrane protein
MLIFKTYVIGLLVLGVLDALWLGVIARDWLTQQLGPLRRDPILWGPALAFYFLYPLAVAILVAAPAVDAGGWTRAALLGGVLGLCAYGTYDLTNWATLKGWPVPMTFVDIAWGGFLTAVVAGASVFVVGQWWR